MSPATHPGSFTETDLEVGQTFRNHTSSRSSRPSDSFRRDRRRLPIQIFRPSIVVGEASTGWTQAFNVLYTPLKAFVQGRLPILPARASSPVDVVPVDYVADAIVELADRPADEGTYHLVAGRGASSVEELIDLASRHSDRSAPLLLPPGLYRGLLHPLLKRRGPARRRRALERLETFFPYFEMDVTYDDRRARAALAQSGIEGASDRGLLRAGSWTSRSEASGGGVRSSAPASVRVVSRERVETVQRVYEYLMATRELPAEVFEPDYVWDMSPSAGGRSGPRTRGSRVPRSSSPTGSGCGTTGRPRSRRSTTSVTGS